MAHERKGPRRPRSTLCASLLEADVLGIEEDLQSQDSQWRRYGIARRKKLLEDDILRGGTKFDVKRRCNVRRYFQVAHRVRPKKLSCIEV